MTNLRPIRGLALAALAMAAGMMIPHSAKAQGLVDFLWGGDSEWGGGRSSVSFSKQYKPGQVIVSFGDRRLYLVTAPGRAISYPIAIPREQSRWQGTTIVSDKRINPSWTPTPDMIKENPRLPRWVPGGHPMNPLGVRALYLGSSTYRIHGTDAPWTIGQAVSKGCVRMNNKDVLDLYPRVPVGSRVTVTWQRFNTSSVASYDDAPASGSSASYSNNPKQANVSASRKSRMTEVSAYEEDDAVSEPKTNDGAPSDIYTYEETPAAAPSEKKKTHTQSSTKKDDTGTASESPAPASKSASKHSAEKPVEKTTVHKASASASTPTATTASAPSNSTSGTATKAGMSTSPQASNASSNPDVMPATAKAEALPVQKAVEIR